MPDHEVSAVYDHEIEDGPRRRAVADWGVGEELFDRMPSRRRFRSTEGGAARRDVHAAEAGAQRRDVHASEAPRQPRERRSPGPEAEHEVRSEPRRRRPSEGDEGALDDRSRTRETAATPSDSAPRRTTAETPSAYTEVDVASPENDAERAVEVPPAPAAGRAELDTLARPAEGRRTVVIRGRGSEPAATPRRSRPPRTTGERIGPRPDRVAAWAVALGVLLILIAILTAH